MGLIAPWFLLGLAALAVPLYLHLLRRTKTPRLFSSLFLFEPRAQTAQRHRRLRHLLLLSLRVGMLTSIMLAFANPFIDRPAAPATAGRLVLLIIDRSFSMRAASRLDDAKQAALSVLNRLRPDERAQVIAFSAQLEVLTRPSRDLAAQRAAVAAIEADDSRGNLSQVASAVRQAADDERAPVDVHVFSDLQRSNLPPNFSEMALPPSARLFVHRVVTAATPNWTVESVAARAQLWGGAGDDTLAVHAVVAGFATPPADRTVSLLVNDTRVASQTVHVAAGGKAAVEFTAKALPHGFNRCEVRIDGADVLPQDDTYRFAVERLDPREVLFIHAASDLRSGLYFGDALAAAEGSAFSLRSVSPAQAAGQPFGRYAFIVVSDLAALSPSLEGELLQYVRGGGNVLVTLGTGAAGHSRVPIAGDGIREIRDYAGGIAGHVERFASVAAKDAAPEWAGDAAAWPAVKVFYTARVDEGDSAVMLRLSDGTPLLLEKKMGEGRVLLFTSGLEGLTNDLPLHPAFVAFVAEIARHLSGLEREASAVVVDSFLDLHTAAATAGATSATSGTGATGVEVIDPQGRRPLSLTEAADARVLRLSESGFYQARLADGRRELIGVNTDRRESDLAVIPNETVALWARNPPAPAAAVAAVPEPPRTEHYALWWLLMLLALLAALAQAVVADLRPAERDEA